METFLGFNGWGAPQLDDLHWKIHLQMDDLGVPLFEETSKWWGNGEKPRNPKKGTHFFGILGKTMRESYPKKWRNTWDCNGQACFFSIPFFPEGHFACFSGLSSRSFRQNDAFSFFFLSICCFHVVSPGRKINILEELNSVSLFP